MSWWYKSDLRFVLADDRGWTRYDSADSSKIEAAFQKGKKVLKLNDDYNIEFEEMIQTRADDRYRRRFIKRTDKKGKTTNVGENPDEESSSSKKRTAKKAAKEDEEEEVEKKPAKPKGRSKKVEEEEEEEEKKPTKPKGRSKKVEEEEEEEEEKPTKPKGRSKKVEEDEEEEETSVKGGRGKAAVSKKTGRGAKTEEEDEGGSSRKKPKGRGEKEEEEEGGEEGSGEHDPEIIGPALKELRDKVSDCEAKDTAKDRKMLLKTLRAFDKKYSGILIIDELFEEQEEDGPIIDYENAYQQTEEYINDKGIEGVLDEDD